MTEEQLTALLRIKRYEQPPPEYFDQLLRDIHRRQRTELLRRPLWKIAIERVQTFFSEHSMGHVPYAGAMATVLVVGIGVIGLMTPGGNVERNPETLTVAAVDPEAASTPKLISLQTSTPVPSLDSPLVRPAPPAFAPAGYQPRYVMDARPVSYEPQATINF